MREEQFGYANPLQAARALASRMSRVESNLENRLVRHANPPLINKYFIPMNVHSGPKVPTRRVPHRGPVCIPVPGYYLRNTTMAAGIPHGFDFQTGEAGTQIQVICLIRRMICMTWRLWAIAPLSSWSRP